MYESPPEHAEQLYASPYTEILWLRPEKIVWVIRRAAAFPDIATARDELTRRSTLLPVRDRSDQSLLLDLRLVRGRNDPQFEGLLDEVRKQVFLGFTRTAIVVRTEVGKLQIHRHRRESGVNIDVFRSVSEAVAALIGART